MARLRYNGMATGSAGSLADISLSGSHTSSVTTLTLNAALTYANGTAVPTLAGGDYFMLSILDAGGRVAEIVKVAAYTSAATSATIVRGQEGTSGVAHASGAKVVHSPTTLDAGPARVKLGEILLTTAASSLDFAAIPSTYEDLEIIFEGLHATSASTTAVTLSFNNDTADANYERTFHFWNFSTDGTATTASRGVLEVSGSTPSKCFGRVLIPSYKRTDFYKAFTSQGTEHGDVAYAVGGEWRNTAAINRVTLRVGDGGNFAIGTRARLYGLRDFTE